MTAIHRTEKPDDADPPGDAAARLFRLSDLSLLPRSRACHPATAADAWNGEHMEALTPWHLLLILIAFVLLAGYKKLPDASRSIGRALRIFRTEMRALDEDAPTAPPPARDQPSAVPSAVGPSPSPSPPPPSPSPEGSKGSTADELDREAAAADELAARLRARAAATATEGRPAVS